MCVHVYTQRHNAAELASSITLLISFLKMLCTPVVLAVTKSSRIFSFFHLFFHVICTRYAHAMHTLYTHYAHAMHTVCKHTSSTGSHEIPKG